MRQRRNGERAAARPAPHRRRSALQFKVSRAVHDGVPAIVVTFTPSRDAGDPPGAHCAEVRRHGDRQAAMEVMRLEAKAIEDIS